MTFPLLSDNKVKPSGDGGNRTHVREHDPEDFYVCSLSFKRSPEDPDRQGVFRFSLNRLRQSSSGSRIDYPALCDVPRSPRQEGVLRERTAIKQPERN